jgi:predicted nucleic acid-binding protein
MPVSYSIQADIIDINADAPQLEDIFFIDTNVWYWLTYPRANSPALSQRSRPNAYQITDYPNYFQNAIVAGATLHCSGLSLSELAHRIERTECEIFGGQHFKVKHFRRNHPPQRTQVVAEISNAWGQITSFASPLNLDIDDSTTNAALSRFTTQLIDGYDVFLLETMQLHSITKVITDDGDYATVPGIQVFTANPKVINAAASQSKLLVR